MRFDSTAVVEQLVGKFASSVDQYTATHGHYLEADARSEFIDPFLRALGWDVENLQALIPSQREVVREQSLPQEVGASKRPDYTLRASGISKLYVEAKKPSVNILTDMESIRQTRAYGWTKQHPIAVLTNFRHIRIFSTVVPISLSDISTTALLFECEYLDLATNLGKIASLIGRSAVNETGWEAQFGTPLATAPLAADKRFIEQFNGWRLQVGHDLVTNSAAMTEDEVNDAAQRILNRLVFVRMCEDRGIEGEGVLREAFNGTITDVVELFKRLNDRYNTGIFRTAALANDPVVLINAATLKAIVENLYAPFSPFSFAVLDADFLGLVYESSLAEHLSIRTTEGKRTVRLNKKREYANRDVVTTPQELVDSTVRAAIDEVDVSLPKTLDFAVGSGRFLLSVFNVLVEREVLRRTNLPGKPGLLKIGKDTYRLSFAEKCALLAEHLFGIDIDFHAVEVARFSLLVRLLEDEVRDTLPSRRGGILPDLAVNIAHGNTLVRKMPANALSGAEEVTRPLDLAQVGLPTAFDLIVGNPPYVSTENMRKLDRLEFEYAKQNYVTAHQQFDKYFLFVEFAVDHLLPGGVLGVVIANKWMTVEAAAKLRAMLRTKVAVRRLTNFRHVQVFVDKEIYVCSLVAKRAEALDFEYAEPDSMSHHADGASTHRTLKYQLLPAEDHAAWVLPANTNEEHVLVLIQRNSIPLKDIVHVRNGVQTSLNRIYLIKESSLLDGIVEFAFAGELWHIEEAITRPYLDDSTRLRSHFEVKADARIIYPYRKTTLAQNRSGFEVIPESVMHASYPLADKFLKAHRSDIEGRGDVSARERKKAFYVYGRTQAIGYADLAPKIVYTVNQRGEKYGLDTTGIAFQSGGTAGEVAIYPRDLGYSLDFVLALLDQPAIEFFLRKRGSPFLGGYYARGSAVMNDVPVPKLDFANESDVEFHDKVSELMVELRKLHAKTATTSERRMTQHQARIDSAAHEVEALFQDRWGLSANTVAKLKA
ncbi:hypothetical protein E5720_16420 [Rhodococcus sp. PAMC28707]|uniref:type I restriction enzyme HsdR N-terminal domain-containing protein n=1 Tax=unclassified Rhodococcus (in: high G+C Gram-positive bacteria) TaxID=192944 RepID=UPI00109D9E63|nr:MULTISPECIES: type I restriction enzyme HsdR N-terminal domain-containing protein [unclassified Rhodococcus (in: high G+C Gram-positive bacteria)]QCB51989.1 hypothetical protein E5769_19100 [Rhodococcus sp. PAMC28705]QCB59842.1 hypothetical protein E5720_16420 [Rhodococcus sp. PAMC28707]